MQIKNSKSNVLFILPTFDTVGPRNIRGKNIIKHLAEDFNISMFCFESIGKTSELENVNIVRKPLGYFFKNIFSPELCNNRPNAIINFIFRLIRFSFKSFLKPDALILQKSKAGDYIKARHEDIDIIVASMFPFSSGSLALDLKKRFYPKSKVILDIGDPLTNNSALKKNKQKFFNYEKDLLTRANHIIVTNSDTKNFYVNHFVIDQTKISVIPQGVNEQFFTKQAIVQKKDHSCLSLVYAGGFYPDLRDPSKLIDSLSTPTVQNKIVFNVYGSNIDAFMNKAIPNIITHKRISNLALIEKYHEADILLFFDNAYGIQTSGKIYELVALKKPILFIYDNKDSKLIQEFKGFSNILFCRNNKKELIKNLMNLDIVIRNLTSSNYNVQSYSWKSKSQLFKNLFLA